MALLERRTYSIALMEFEVEVLEVALSHCQTLCRQALAQGRKSPFSIDDDLWNIRKRVSRAAPVFEHEIPDELFYDPSIHINLSHLRNYTLTLNEDEMMALDALLLRYQTDCRKKLRRGTKSPDHALNDWWIGYFRRTNGFIRR
jgi:hypothetical protein